MVLFALYFGSFAQDKVPSANCVKLGKWLKNNIYEKVKITSTK